MNLNYHHLRYFWAVAREGSVTSAAVTIDAGSYASKNDKRNEHIHSANFLDVDDHPTLRFGLTQLIELEPGRTRVSIKRMIII